MRDFSQKVRKLLSSTDAAGNFFDLNNDSEFARPHARNPTVVSAVFSGRARSPCRGERKGEEDKGGEGAKQGRATHKNRSMIGGANVRFSSSS